MAVDVARVQERVLGWFSEHARAFPWRDSRDPYATMVAEVMLQQTQTGRVGPSYESFLKEFPSSTALAHAPAMDVIRAWKGLGYNKRAVNLQRAAQVIEAEHGGIVPEDVRVLRTLPGLGAYTASAIACFAYDAQIPVIDVNVTRVLARAGLGVEPEKAKPERVERLAGDWLPDGNAYEWNQALMDIGATLCRISAPLCSKCPLKTSCAYKAKGKDKAPRAKTAPKQSRFEGSARQKRGGIVDALRAHASDGITMRALADAIHPEGDPNLYWLVDLLEGLERDGLVTMSPAARKGSARGVVKLPS